MGLFRPAGGILLVLDPFAVLVLASTVRRLLVVVNIVSYNHVKAGVCALHLGILLQKSSILHLWVAVSKLVLNLRLLMAVTSPALCQRILGVFLILNHRVHLIIFELAVTRVVLRIRQRQNVAALVRVSDVDVLLDLVVVKVLIVVFLGLSDARVGDLASLRFIISRRCQMIGMILERL